MNKTVIIIGSVALLGVGAYLYFKGKAKPNEETMGTDTTGTGTTGTDTTGTDTTGTDTTGTDTTGTGTTGTGTTTVNPSTGTVVPKVDEVLQVSNSTKNAQEAVTLASQIFELKNKKSKYANMSLSEFSKTKEGKEDFFKSSIGMLEMLKEGALKEFDRQLKILTDKIVVLGYIEVNGNIAKLNSNNTKNTQEAVTLASQIFELKNKKSKYANMSLSEFSKTKEGKEDFFKSSIGMLEMLKEGALKEFDRQLKILNDKMVALGYIEVNGSIAKLNL
jgi:hypothetical protein